MKKYQANLLLFLVALIWGGGFIFVQILLDLGMSAGLISTFRGLIFTICAFVLFYKKILKMTLADLKVGLIAGFTNAVGFLMQTVGQSLTSSSHTAVLTAMYVIFVPLVCMVVYRARLPFRTWIAVFLCVLGAILLIGDGLRDSGGSQIVGDIIVLVGSLMFAVNIAYLGKSGKQTHFGVVSFFLGLTLFITSGVYVLIAGDFSLPTENAWAAVGSVLYLGVLSSALCQILQVMCQRYTSPESATILLNLECLFGGIFSVLYGDKLTPWLLIGGLAVIISVFVQEADFTAIIKRRKKEKQV